MSTKKTLSSWLSTKYQLIVRNEENLSEKSTFGFTYAKLIVLSGILFTVLMFSSLYLSRTILAKWFDPEYAAKDANTKIIDLMIKVDSLSYEVQRKDMFINAFKNILNDDFGGLDSNAVMSASLSGSANLYIENDYIAPVDSMIRKEYEEQGDLYNRLSNQYSSEMEDLFLFSPISGIVSAIFNPKESHYGVDIVAKTDEPVKSIAEGSVLLASWTQDSGYIIVVQHRDNLISVYKHNSALLKKVGNFVNAGEIISFIGNTGEYTTGPHLHFELWYNGNPVNPEEYVSF